MAKASKKLLVPATEVKSKVTLGERVRALHSEGKTAQEITDTLKEEGYRSLRTGKALNRYNVSYEVGKLGGKKKPKPTKKPKPKYKGTYFVSPKLAAVRAVIDLKEVDDDEALKLVKAIIG